MSGWLAVAMFLLQGRPPTVGDTVWLSRTVALPQGHVVRAADWEPADPVELLGRPRVIISGDSAGISYPVVIWRPGTQTIELPGPLLLGPGGTVDSLPGQVIRLTVRSVLPVVPADSTLPPQPRASLVARQAVSLAPVAVLWSLALAILIPLHLWWRRRGPAMPAVRLPTDLADPPLDRWADAGEYRAVANVAAVRLRSTVARQVTGAHAGLDTERLLAELAAVRPHWPLAELATVLRQLDDARFGISGSPDALELSRSTMELRDRLLRDAA
ncbi:MAG TPA: hypothetical protein VFZ87_11130 [Gemmatimonadales bacterium]